LIGHIVDQEYAVELWKMTLANRFKHLELWIQFLISKHNRAISKDTWALLIEFIRQVNDQMTNYDSEGSLFNFYTLSLKVLSHHS
jgi:DCN1-like protein 1/2